MITLIVARDRNGAIGKDNEIPWHAPEDLAFFQKETFGGAVIMGRNTWNSLPYKPLKNRLNLVVSSDPDLGHKTHPTIQSAINEAHQEGIFRIYGIGGAGIYKAMLPLAHRLLITEIDIVVPQADTFFPTIDSNLWTQIGSKEVRARGPNCVLTEFVRTNT